MRIKLMWVGKTADAYLQDGIKIYELRLKNYISFSIIELPDVKQAKNLHPEQLMEKEADIILKNIDNTDTLVLLDEHGKAFTSVAFSQYIEKSMVSSVSSLVLLVGGAYGVSNRVKQRANLSLSLSNMTFSHQMVRLFMAEQLYRAFTIIRNEPYHHA